MKNSKWIGLAACVLLIAVCFMPWTYHADVQKNFTGFFSQNNAYGKPGKFLIFFSITAFILIYTQKVWAKRILLFLSAVMLAYAIKTFILYSSCYNAYCPEKKPGIFLMLLLAIIIFGSSLFSDIKISANKNK